ncbi:3-oxoacyl-ACP reductase [Streptomyces sp. NPDC041068]|uniref:3-oxoacyl-ACP reductase n=1 Tax=Streptomyces sp. NPDC041068 TaxID=3155130 RepID=UPI0033EF843F
MADRYLTLTATAPGRFLTRRLGLPQPTRLRRWSPDSPGLGGESLLLTTSDSPYAQDLLTLLESMGNKPTTTTPLAPTAVVLDATTVATTDALAEVHAKLHPVVRKVKDNGRIVVLGAPLNPADHHQSAVQQALEGFVRSLAKELGRGRTACLVRVPGPIGTAESTLRFLLSPKSAYVTGQVIETGPAEAVAAPTDWSRPLAGRTALVTGAARGIGEAVAEILTRDGAKVTVLDIPSAQQDLARVAARLGGTALPLDITAPDAGERITAALPEHGLDILVHNAGITRDRKLANMDAARWSSVLDVNLAAVLTTTDTLLKTGTIRPGGRIVATASIAGIAGNAGQTNYAAGKAGIIGMVHSLAPRALAEHGVTVNAVAPGFIETRMTAAVPPLIREAGRRMNSLAQGGLPVDVAEATSWLAQGGMNAQTIRVCGQSLLGA